MARVIATAVPLSLWAGRSYSLSQSQLSLHLGQRD